MEYGRRSTFLLLVGLFCLTVTYTILGDDAIVWILASGLFHVQEVLKDTSSQPCTFALFREAYKRQGYFPAGGKWFETAEGIPYFQPDLCRYRYVRVPSSFMTRCLSKDNLSYVLTIGDSTVAAYSASLVRTLTLDCKRLQIERLKEDGFLPDKEYFTRQMPEDIARFVTEKFRFCKGCASKLHRLSVW